MNRGWSVVAGAALLTQLACSQRGELGQTVRRSGDKSTREALIAALASSASSGVDVDLAAHVRGEWTRVLFVCPYGNEKDVSNQLGFAWDDYPGPDESEGLVTFVFASSAAVVTWATLDRNLGDPCTSPTPPLRTAAKESAVFKVAKTGTTIDGRPFYSLLPKR